MERIGFAASKIAKGNLLSYNLWVIGLSFLCSCLIFVIAGSSVLLSLLILGYLVDGMLPQDFSQTWTPVIRLCMVSLTVIVSLINVFAIVRNIKLKK